MSDIAYFGLGLISGVNVAVISLALLKMTARKPLSSELKPQLDRVRESARKLGDTADKLAAISKRPVGDDYADLWRREGFQEWLKERRK